MNSEDRMGIKDYLRTSIKSPSVKHDMFGARHFLKHSTGKKRLCAYNYKLMHILDMCNIP